EVIHFVLGGLFYLLSPAFRQKKRQQWKSRGSMVKVYEVGMWLTIPFIVVLIVVATIATPLH
ncbi:MAG: hypothetical protein PVJ72_09325, partial [Gammaproteobacteria bacterium]